MSDAPSPNPVDASGLDKVMADKKAKIADMRARGIDPFPARTTRQDDCAKVIVLGTSAHAVLANTRSPGLHLVRCARSAGRSLSCPPRR